MATKPRPTTPGNGREACMRSVNTKRYIPYTPRTVPVARIVVHNHIRPEGFPDVIAGLSGFRVWSDVPTGQIATDGSPYRVIICRCGWAPHLAEHYRVNFDAAAQEAE